MTPGRRPPIGPNATLVLLTLGGTFAACALGLAACAVLGLLDGRAGIPFALCNVALIVVLGPPDRVCSTSGALEQAQGEKGDRDAGWVVWWDSYLGRNNPSGVPFDESKIFGGKPMGRYRICAYTIGQGEGPDPYVATSLDLAIGGTCATATQRAHAHRKLVTRSKKRLQRARRALRRTLRNGNLRKVKVARNRVRAKQRALKKARPRLADALETRKALCG